MTFADRIVAISERYHPRIERRETCIVFCWARPEATIKALAELTGLDRDLFEYSYRDVRLEIPNEIASLDAEGKPEKWRP